MKTLNIFFPPVSVIASTRRRIFLGVSPVLAVYVRNRLNGSAEKALLYHFLLSVFNRLPVEIKSTDEYLFIRSRQGKLEVFPA
jgi:hypothetical protein